MFSNLLFQESCFESSFISGDALIRVSRTKYLTTSSLVWSFSETQTVIEFRLATTELIICSLTPELKLQEPHDLVEIFLQRLTIY